MAPDRKHPYRKLDLPKNALFELRPSPGKGWGSLAWGTFAIKPIKKGSQILHDKAWFVVVETGVSRDVSRKVKAEVSRLPRALKKQFTSIRELITHAQIDDIKKNVMPVEYRGNMLAQIAFERVTNGMTDDDWAWWRIMCMNSFNIKDPKSELICPLASRLNHSCQPNCYATVNHDGVVICASRDIAKGEELAFSYWSGLEDLTKDDRTKLLDWECLCDLCTARPHVKQLSDSRRVLLRACYQVFRGKDEASEHKLIEFKSGFPDEYFRMVVKTFRVPLGKRIVYLFLLLALLEVEGLLTPSEIKKPVANIELCAGLFENHDAAAIVKRALEIGQQQTWAQAFGEVCGLWAKEDPGDAGAPAVLRKALEDGEKDIPEKDNSGDDGDI